MRVVVNAMLLGEAHTGVEVSIAGLCQGLREVLRDGQALFVHRPVYPAGELEGPRTTTHQAPAWTSTRPGRILWERLCLSSVARAWGADLLHAPGYVAPPGWRGPLVLTVYDILALTHPEWCKWSNRLHLRRALLPSIRRADIVIVPSQAVKAQLMEHLNADPQKIRVVALGISRTMTPASEAAVAALRRAYDLPGPYLLWVGNIEPKKNLCGLIRAFELAGRDIPHDLVLAGKPAWGAAPDLRAIAHSPLRTRIRCLGYVPAGLLPALYSGADLLVHWSLYEGAGLTPLEAMACGTPAIVSDGGALPELAGQVAPVVPLPDPARLAAELLALLADSGRREALAARGRQWAQQFTWTAHATRVLALYEEAASRGSR